MEENKSYLKEQIITYLGNKRSLLSKIEECVLEIKKELCKKKIVSVDLFSGSGIVARMLKQHSTKVIANDLEHYSYIINSCYLSNRNEFEEDKYQECLEIIKNKLKKPIEDGIIRLNYSPKDEDNISETDRVFYTIKNAITIDTIRKAIDEIPYKEYQKFFIAPLLYESSVHVNTSGVFKGFYKTKKDEQGKQYGKYGGEGANALERIKGDIKLKKPILSNFETDYEVYMEDANELVKRIDEVDLIYIDPPYNQHPYGSNYFMLNTIVDNKIDGELSKVAGIPKMWNKSRYNKKNEIKETFSDLISNCRSKYVLVSYNSEGFLMYNDIVSILGEYGEVSVVNIEYPTFRASRNLQNRNKHVTEFIFILKKK